ncbi:hypothetical protein L1987_89314 [Smallanthus sonchifolius]|nr:hypothetical protein L1987_89314 [Smallanthus sonchifolius]
MNAPPRLLRVRSKKSFVRMLGHRLVRTTADEAKRNAAIPRGSSLKKVSRNNVAFTKTTERMKKRKVLFEADLTEGRGGEGPPRLEPSQINKNEESKHVVGNATEVKSRVKKAMALAVERD